MSNIKELANVPEISFIENMSLQETEELVRANYTRIFKELTGQDAELGEADAKNLIIKSFSLVLYQVMQYVEAKGRAELLKTSTGDALDALAALFGIMPVSNLQIIEELCGICTDLAKIVTEQQRLLTQYDAIALAEDIDRVKVRYTALIGSGEWPDEALGEEL